MMAKFIDGYKAIMSNKPMGLKVGCFNFICFFYLPDKILPTEKAMLMSRFANQNITSLASL